MLNIFIFVQIRATIFDSRLLVLISVPSIPIGIIGIELVVKEYFCSTNQPEEIVAQGLDSKVLVAGNRPKTNQNLRIFVSLETLERFTSSLSFGLGMGIKKPCRQRPPKRKSIGRRR